jgi:hypothetical protein
VRAPPDGDEEREEDERDKPHRGEEREICVVCMLHFGYPRMHDENQHCWLQQSESFLQSSPLPLHCGMGAGVGVGGGVSPPSTPESEAPLAQVPLQIPEQHSLAPEHVAPAGEQ